ncbi:hypothetical protein [Brevundimonas sp.]|uniref:hypothetical protein n=1 Tax=Brevundimonas sp. TaxID=1871086 RepID=UPI002D46F101|nr:hypothetical protein [Brevundimonas sp.]HYD26433.1 hypothetical protein [Brevundimonas sp.]
MFDSLSRSGFPVLIGGVCDEFLVGALSLDVVYGRAGSSRREADAVDALYGEPGDTFVLPGSPSAEFTGTDNNLIIGGAGNDTLRGGGGTDQIRGGLGTDTIVLQGLAADYTITAEGAGWRIIDGTGGRDGSILALDIETLRFGDGSTQALGGAPAPLLSGSDQGPLTLPAMVGDKAVFADGEPLVLPSAEDDAFLPLTLWDDAQVLPAVDDDQPLILPGEGVGKAALIALQMEESTVIGPVGLMLLDSTDDHSHPHDPWA